MSNTWKVEMAFVLEWKKLVGTVLTDNQNLLVACTCEWHAYWLTLSIYFLRGISCLVISFVWSWN